MRKIAFGTPRTNDIVMEDAMFKPWVEIVTYDKGDQVNLYEPYKNADLSSEPRVVTIAGALPYPETTVVGLKTTTRSVKSGTVICNTLQLGTCISKQRPGTPHEGSQKTSGCEELRLRALCLRLSDVLCIVAKDLRQGIKQMIHFIDAAPQLENWPVMVMMISSDGPAAAFKATERTRTEFVRHMGETWKALRRAGGRYSKAFQQCVEKTRVRDYTSIDSFMQNDLQLLLKSSAPHRLPHLSLKGIIDIIERYCAVPELPTAYASRGKYWPGVSPQLQSTLTEWLCLLDGTPSMTGDMATVFSQLFLRDAEVVAPSRSHIDSIPSLLEVY